MTVLNQVTMKHLCLIFLLAFIPKIGFGQFTGDTVTVYVDNKVEIALAIPNYDNLRSPEQITEALTSFQEMIPRISSQLSDEAADLVKFEIGGELTVEPGEPKSVFLMKNGEMTNTGFRDKAIISGEDFKIIITASDLTVISGMTLDNCLQEIAKILPRKSSWSKSLYYEYINKKVSALEDQHKNNNLDFIELSLGAGAGLVKNTWVPDLTFGVALGFYNKGVIRHNPYITTNMLFDFSTEDKMNINTFLNVGYRWNYNKQKKKKDLLGVEVGYLISRQGNLFDKDTFKFGLNWSAGSGISVSPHVYISDNFKTIYPGIRIGFGL